MVGCEWTRVNEALRFIFDTVTVQVLDPHPNIMISVSCPFMLNSEMPVEFDVRLRQDRSIHLTTVRFGSSEPGIMIQLVNRTVTGM